MRNRIARSLRAVAVLGVCVATSAGISYAAIPSNDGTIEACYVKSGKNEGRLRLVDVEAGKSCKLTENPISWNQQGPPGLADVEVVTESLPPADGEVKQIFVKCPVGKRAIGGGGWAVNHLVVASARADGLQIVQSSPDLHQYQYGWLVIARSDAPYQWTIGAQVVCATVG